MHEQYFFEVTDTFGGEANYSWVRRYLVRAKSLVAALRKVAREAGYSGRLRRTLACNDLTRWDVRGAAVCILGHCSDGFEQQAYLRIQTMS